MTKPININILKGIDSVETDQLFNAFQFVCKKLKIEANINLESTLSILPDDGQYLIIHLDEITLSQLVNQSKVQEFFVSKSFKNSQILLMLEDISIDQLPEYLHYLPAFELYLNQKSSSDSKSLKRTTFVQVVHDMVLFIKEANQKKEDALTIFIGPSDDNTTIEYQKILRELLHRNHHIIPEVLNPSAKELIDNPQSLETTLADTDLCIHFIGHGSISNYPDKASPAMKVNDLVAEYCTKNSKIQRIIYVPDEDENTTENVRLKILQFKSNLKALKNAELVQTPVEKFKDIVLTKIQEIFMPVEDVHVSEEEKGELYFIYAPGQEKNVGKITTWFNSQKFNYSISQIDQDQLALIKYHQGKLKNCDGVVIFNHGNKEWLSRKLSDLLKAPGWGRKKQFKYKAVIGNDNDSVKDLGQVALAVKFIKQNNETSFDELKAIIQN